MMDMQNGLFVPERFRNIVALHIIKNLLRNQDIQTPLILGIHGASGEGKTFQCDLVFKELNVTALRIAAKEFESETAGDPGKLLCEKYLEASDQVERNKNSSAVLFVNDLDTGIGHWGGDVQYTVNTQLVVATLMDIADYPESVSGRQTERIPIIVTGNDFTKLYEPLTRAGRMDTHSWTPTFVEKTDIVRRNIFPMQSLTDDEIAGLVNSFRQMPVAFFSLLKSRLGDEHLLQKIKDDGISRVLQTAKSNSRSEICTPDPSLEVLLRKASEIASDEIINHLRRN